MNIAFFELEKWEEEYMKERLKKHKLLFFNKPFGESFVDKVKGCEVIVCFIHSEMQGKLLEKLPKLKYITTMSTGFDHIDLDFCKEKRIMASNVPYYGENTVAEQTFALLLALSRKIYDAIERTKRDDFSIAGLMGFDLKGKTLGVIGPGHIGQHVIKIAKGFEMNVVSFSNHIDKKLSKECGFRWAKSFNDLLKESDIITIHVPLTDDTRHLINMNNIKYIKKGAYLINTSRGEIIETKALMYALAKGTLAGAGLDVLEGESNIREERQLLGNGKERDWEIFLENHLILKEHNVIVTPHSAFFTKEALQRILDTTIGNINSFVKGKVENSVY